MSDQQTSDSARDALSSVKKMQAAGARRAAWPRWAYLAEAVITAITVTGLVYPFKGLFGVWALIVLLAVGVAMRVWFLKKFRTFPFYGWLDALLVTVSIAALFAAEFLARLPGFESIALAAGLVFGIGYFVRTEVRRAAAKRMEKAP